MHVLSKKNIYEIKSQIDKNKFVKMDTFYQLYCERIGDKVKIVLTRGATPSGIVSTKWIGNIVEDGIELERKKTFGQVIMFLFVLASALFSGFIIMSQIVAWILGFIRGNGVLEMSSVIVTVLLIVFLVACICWYKYMYYKRPEAVLCDYLKKYIL